MKYINIAVIPVGGIAAAQSTNTDRADSVSIFTSGNGQISTLFQISYFLLGQPELPSIHQFDDEGRLTTCGDFKESRDV